MDAGQRPQGQQGSPMGNQGGDTMTLEQLDRDIRAIEGEGAAERAISINPGEICAVYQDLKPILNRILPLIERFSPPAASVIRRLMSLLDMICAALPEPGTTPAPTPNPAG